jgi:hypothetical protein
MRYALQLGIICFITYNFYGDPELHEPFGQILFFAIWVSYGTVWLIDKLPELLVFLFLAIRYSNCNPCPWG